jgi:SAM-dependent methyltransferase
MKLSQHLRERACPVCGSKSIARVAYPSDFDETKLDDFAFASRKLPEFMHFRLVECATCQLVYASPAPAQDFLAGAYHDAAYDSNDEAVYAAKTYAASLPRILARTGNIGAALEVGAGNGAFLLELRRAGVPQVVGVEPSAAAAGAAEPSIRPLIRVTMFHAADFVPGSLALFACFQTLEHVEDPRRLCEAAFELLQPGGAIYLVVHDHNSWVTRLLGKRSPIFDIEHLQLFSKASLRYLLEITGFSGVEIATIRNRYPLAYWVRLPPLPRSIKRAAIAGLNAAGLGRIPIALNIGNLAAVGYKMR